MDQLYNDLDHDSPIATYHPTPGEPGEINLQREVEGIIDTLVISFLILEQKMRVVEKAGVVAQASGYHTFLNTLN